MSDEYRHQRKIDLKNACKWKESNRVRERETSRTENLWAYVTDRRRSLTRRVLFVCSSASTEYRLDAGPDFDEQSALSGRSWLARSMIRKLARRHRWTMILEKWLEINFSHFLLELKVHASFSCSPCCCLRLFLSCYLLKFFPLANRKVHEEMTRYIVP